MKAGSNMLADLRREVRLYFRLIIADGMARIGYRASFFFLTFSSFIMFFFEFLAVYFLLSRFPSLAGWSIGEVAFLYGLSTMTFGIGGMIAGGFDSFPRLIRNGELDRLFLRPMSLTLQICGTEFQPRRVGRIVQGALILYIATTLHPVTWTIPKIIYLPVALASGSALFIGVFVLTSTLCFWTVQTNEVANIFTNGGAEMAAYPLDIYNDFFRRFFIFVIPLAFVTYFPTLFFLDRPIDSPLLESLGLSGLEILGISGSGVLPFLPPVVAVIFLVIAWRVWRFGVSHYQSTGS